MWKSIKSVFSSEPDYETEILDVFVKSITDFGDNPGDERLLGAIKQAINTFNQLHETKAFVLSKETGDGIVKFMLEAADSMGLSKGNEELVESWRKF